MKKQLTGRNYVKIAGILAIFIMLLLAAGFAYKKRVGIYNILNAKIGFTLPYKIIEPWKKSYGFYKQEVAVESNLDETVSILENDLSKEQIDTSINKEDTLVKNSLQIDEMVQAELDRGIHTWEEPMTILNPYQISPLTALVLFQTDEAVKVKVSVKGKTEATDIIGEVEEGTSHRVPVIGLYPGMENTVVLELIKKDGTIVDRKELKIETEKLPDSLSKAISPVTTSGESAYQMTLVYGQRNSLPFAFDCMGEIRWYMDKQTANYGLYSLANGRMIFQDTAGYTPSQQKPQSTNLYEIDYLGRAYTMYYLPGGSHHEVIEKEPGGNLLALSSTMKLHYEDEVIEIDKKTGEIVNALDLREVLDGTYETRADWAHINSISYQAEDHSVILSCRNIHSVIKVDWETHELKWILADPRFWKGTKFEEYVLQPEEEFMYFFQQHSAYQVFADLDDNPDTMEISLFDNHNQKDRKVDYFEDTDESYSVIYSINEKNNTVSETKKIPVIYSKITSNTIYDQESNHIFAMCGWVPNEPNKNKGMIYEFDYENGDIINQYILPKTFYRASEMILNYMDLSSKMEVDENYIKGELRPAIEVDKAVKTPIQKIEEEKVSFHMLGNVLYVTTLDHRISQLIFKGENQTYVWDAVKIRLYTEDYLDYQETIPIPLQNLAQDQYEILCVYENEFYQTGQTFKKA